ncbi:MAG: glycosyltransferase [Ardenticatenaceae bacterium]|nr:glycosyltransferase [Ardenticatenaceae bacterium]HBY98432.1 glucosyl transferase [Chloroflexota bacterium]
MRIVIAGHTYDPTLNGQGRFTVHLAEGLARAGHQVTVIVPSDRGRAYATSQNNVCLQAITALPLTPLYGDVFVPPRAGAEAGPLLDTVRPEIVHIQDHYPLSRGVLRAALKRGIPLIGTNHFLPENITPYVPIVSRFEQGRALLDRLLWKMVLDVFNRLDLATAPTETAATILRRHALQVPVRAISCGVDVDRFRPDPHVNRTEICLRYGLDPQRTILLYVGRIAREKRLDVLLQALYRLQRDDVQLAIAGRGRDLAGLLAFASQLKLGRRVVFTGYVPSEDLPALLNSADIFTMPSEAELESIATLEAMATGRPLLASDARALPELVEHDVNGYLFQAGNIEDAARRMAELVDRRDCWAAMGAASLAIVQRHDLSTMLRRYEALYYSLLERLATGRTE